MRSSFVNSLLAVLASGMVVGVRAQSCTSSLQHYTIDQVAQLASAAGFSCNDLIQIIAIAGAESGNDPGLKCTNGDGSVDAGLWQINEYPWRNYQPFDQCQEAGVTITCDASNKNQHSCCVTNSVRIDAMALNDRAAATEAARRWFLTPLGPSNWSAYGGALYASLLGSADTFVRNTSPYKDASCFQHQQCTLVNGHLICPPQPPTTATQVGLQPVTSLDPNDKVGPHGIGSSRFISSRGSASYAVYFENEPTATAAAQVVRIADTLDSNLDLTTVSLGPIAVANQVVKPPVVPLSLTAFMTTLDLRPTTNLLVNIAAALNTTTAVLTWTFQSLDPTTNQPPTDPLAGFLPPGAEGSVFFTVVPKSRVTTSTVIQNTATVVFDQNPPINTPTWFNTIDNTAPTSKVSALPPTEATYSFPVQWSGTDVGAGVQDLTIYVSDNGGSFTPWLTNSTATQATYPGIGGHTYSFYSIARDLVGNVEGGKTVAEATTQVLVDTTPPVIVPQISGTLGNNGWYRSNVTVTWNVNDPESGIASATGCTQTTLSNDIAGVTLSCSATNGAGLSTTVGVTIKIDKTPPVISGMPAAGCSLWPPDHQLVQVATATASDALSGVAPGSFTVTGSSNEPSSNPNDPEIMITPNGSGGLIVQLQADRLGTGTGRVYTLTATSSDLAGNTTTVNSTCTVPHDQGQ